MSRRTQRRKNQAVQLTRKGMTLTDAEIEAAPWSPSEKEILRTVQRLTHDHYVETGLKPILKELALRAKPLDPHESQEIPPTVDVERLRAEGYNPDTFSCGSISAAELIAKYDLNGQDGLTAILAMIQLTWPTVLQFDKAPNGSTQIRIRSSAIEQPGSDQVVEITEWEQPPMRDVLARAVGRGIFSAEDVAKLSKDVRDV